MLEKIKEMSEQMLDGDLEVALPLIDLLKETGQEDAADWLTSVLLDFADGFSNGVAHFELRPSRSQEEKAHRLNEMHYDLWCKFNSEAQAIFKSIQNGPPDLSFVKELGKSINSLKQASRLKEAQDNPDEESGDMMPGHAMMGMSPSRFRRR